MFKFFSHRFKKIKIIYVRFDDIYARNMLENVLFKKKMVRIEYKSSYQCGQESARIFLDNAIIINACLNLKFVHVCVSGKTKL